MLSVNVFSFFFINFYFWKEHEKVSFSSIVQIFLHILNIQRLLFTL